MNSVARSIKTTILVLNALWCPPSLAFQFSLLGCVRLHRLNNTFNNSLKKMKSITRIALALALIIRAFSTPTQAAELCIEKSTLRAIKSSEPALGYFIGSAYYLLDENNSNIISKFDEKPPYAQNDIKSAILFALDKKAIDGIKFAYENQQKRNVATIKKTPLSAILWQQFKAMQETNPNNIPDFLIFQQFPPSIVTVEILFSIENKSFLTLTPNKKSFTPAFFYQADAKKFQEEINAQSKEKYDRATLDFSTFLREFMVPQLNSSAPIVVFGEDGINLVHQFNATYK